VYNLVYGLRSLFIVITLLIQLDLLR